MCSLALAGCGGGDGGDLATGTQPRETADSRPELPGGWKRVVNRTAGFNLAIPPRWTAAKAEEGNATLIRSPDRLAAVSITADRTDEALDLPLGRFAAETIQNLKGFRDLDPDRPERLRGVAYDAVSVTASGVSSAGVRQKLVLVLMRREGFAAYPILVARNADAGKERYDAEITGMLESFRGQPIETGFSD